MLILLPANTAAKGVHLVCYLKCFKDLSRFNATDKIHHCRACGEGFCSVCSSYQRPVPERGWGFQPVRVCKPCYEITQATLETSAPSVEPNEVQVRKVGETVYGTVSSLANALEFPISILKDSARPDYWVPDHEISSCAVCDKEIGANAPTSQVNTLNLHISSMYHASF